MGTLGFLSIYKKLGAADQSVADTRVDSLLAQTRADYASSHRILTGTVASIAESMEYIAVHLTPITLTTKNLRWIVTILFLDSVWFYYECTIIVVLEVLQSRPTAAVLLVVKR